MERRDDKVEWMKLDPLSLPLHGRVLGCLRLTLSPAILQVSSTSRNITFLSPPTLAFDSVQARDVKAATVSSSIKDLKCIGPLPTRLDSPRKEYVYESLKY